MKKIAIILSLVFVASLMVSAQSESVNNETKNPNAPVITFDKVVHDYGTIYQGSDGKCEFVFKNTGKEPLILSKPRSSCGCTVPQWPKQPILPGESDKITVTYNTKKIGVINKTVTIYSNASNKSVVLRIKGKVVAKPASVMPEKSSEGAPSNK